MPRDTICKTVRQHSDGLVSPENMRKLKEIAADYNKVKNHVYQRYGGIRSLSKLYPGYSIQNEMTESGLRAELGMPSVYFYLAIFDALSDIKAQWTRTKSAINAAINANERLTLEEKHYLRFVMRVSGCFENILTDREPVVPKEMQAAYQDVSEGIDKARLDRYLCRQVRRKLKKLHTSKEEGFAASERAYRYGDHGIYISTKEKRKRIYIPLTDENQYKRQIYIKLKPEKSAVEINVPIEMEIRHHPDYQNEIGLSLGIWQLFTTDSGRVYGENFREIHMAFVDFVRASASTYRRERRNNPGRKKYKDKKAKLDRKLEIYVNQEINRMLSEEKPRIIYLPKLPHASSAGINRKINHSTNMWKRGYIQRRLEQKCRENAVRIVEVPGEGISLECSQCGQPGTCHKDTFQCACCGYQANRKTNAAKNAKKRGLFDQESDPWE